MNAQAQVAELMKRVDAYVTYARMNAIGNSQALKLRAAIEAHACSAMHGVDLVTRESALEAIDYVAASNCDSCVTEAVEKLKPNEPGPTAEARLYACDQSTGKEFFVRAGPRHALQVEAQTRNESGRDYFLKQ